MGSPDLRWVRNGAFGVDIFFPISGFVMYFAATSLWRRMGPKASVWKEFVWRRLLRIVPLYWLLTTLKLLLYLAVPAVMAHYTFRSWNAVASYLFIPSIGEYNQPLPVIPVGWTLNYEMFFYLIVTLALATRVRLLRWVAVTIVTLAVVGLFIPHAWGALTYLADPIELEFLGGMCLAAYLPLLQRVPAWAAAIVFPAALLAALAWPIPGELVFVPMRALMWGIPGVLLVAAVLVLERHLPIARWRGLLLLGDASYSLYLTHTFAIVPLGMLAQRLHLHGGMGMASLLLGGTAICIAAAVLFHLWVELPMMRWLGGRRVPWSVQSAEQT